MLTQQFPANRIAIFASVWQIITITSVESFWFLLLLLQLLFGKLKFAVHKILHHQMNTDLKARISVWIFVEFKHTRKEEFSKNECDRSVEYAENNTLNGKFLKEKSFITPENRVECMIFLVQHAKCRVFS